MGHVCSKFGHARVQLCSIPLTFTTRTSGDFSSTQCGGPLDFGIQPGLQLFDILTPFTQTCGLLPTCGTTVFHLRSSDESLQHFSVLTASSHLTRLSIQAAWDNQIPAQAMQFILPAGKQLPQLKELIIAGLADPDYGVIDVNRVVSCCPNLEELTLSNVMPPDAPTDGLTALEASFTSLALAGSAFTDSTAAAVAQLSILRDLEWSGAQSSFTNDGLRKFTALRQLTSLCVHDCDHISPVLMPCGGTHLELKSDPEVS